jgi:hypothetical protein
MSDRAVIIDWFRADNSKRMGRVLVVGATSMLTGGLVIAVSFLTHQAEHVRELSAGFGIVIVAGSAAFTSFSMRAILKEDSSISLRTDGVAFQVGTTETLVLWADVASARWDDARQALVLERAGAEPVVVPWRPARISGPDLAARIERDKQRASMGLLR